MHIYADQAACMQVQKNICAHTETCMCYKVVWCVTGHSERW